MPAVRTYVTRRLARRCHAAGPAYNTRGVFGRRVIRPEDFNDPESAPVPEPADMHSEPIRDAAAEQLARIRQLDGVEKEQHIVALLLFLTLNVDRLRANQIQLNAYRAIARHYSEVGIVAWAAANDFLAASE